MKSKEMPPSEVSGGVVLFMLAMKSREAHCFLSNALKNNQRWTKVEQTRPVLVLAAGCIDLPELTKQCQPHALVF